MDCFRGEKGYIGFGHAIVSSGERYNAHEHNIRRQVSRMSVEVLPKIGAGEAWAPPRGVTTLRRVTQRATWQGLPPFLGEPSVDTELAGGLDPLYDSALTTAM